MNTDKDYYNEVLTQINELMDTRGRYMLGSINIISEEDYKNLKTQVNEQLNNCFVGNASKSTALESFNEYFMQAVAKIAVDLHPTVDQINKIRNISFPGVSVTSLFWHLTEDNIDLIYELISNTKLPDESAISDIKDILNYIDNQLNDTMNDFVSDGENKIPFDSNRLKESVQNLLKNHYDILKTDIDDDNSFPNEYSQTLSEQILGHIKKLFCSEVWHEFTQFLPTLPSRDPTQPKFVVSKCPIVELEINNTGVLGNYPNLMTEKDIQNMFDIVLRAINNSSLNGINYIRSIGATVDKDFSLLIKSSNEKMPSLDKIETLLNSTCDFYHDNKESYIFFGKDFSVLQKFVQKEWLDLSVPALSNKILTKKKI